ncbi:MAG: substrate-binding domain-containing protein [Solirubrobacteraceae bacterium]
MIVRLRVLALIAFGAVMALVASGCGGSQASPLPQQPGLPAIKADPANAPVGAAAGVNVFGLSRHRIRFFVITHGQASDPFWAVVQNGAEAAAAQLGVSVTYEAPDTYDIARMRQLIQTATATRPAGLVVSLPNPTALAPAIHAAERAKLPVISINSGSDAFAKLGTLLHVGQSEYQAGHAAGQRMRTRHVHRALCVIHEAGNLALEQRCRGFAAALAAGGAHTSVNRRAHAQSAPDRTLTRWRLSARRGSGAAPGDRVAGHTASRRRWVRDCPPPPGRG